MSKITKKFLPNVKLCSRICNMDMIKKAIKAELKRRGWTNYRLTKELKGKLPERSIYAYLTDDEDGANKRDISAKRASIILKELGLKINKVRK